ncbi:MAG: anthranilate synthase component I family protein [Planctomycetota bacterium]
MLPLSDILPYDFDPLEALRRWPADRPVALLHSGRLHPTWARYSLIAEPVAALVHDHGRSTWAGPAPRGAPELRHDALTDFDAVVAADPAIYIGHLGYDLARAVERLPNAAQDDHGTPTLRFERCPHALLYDHHLNRWHAVGPDPAALPDLSQPATPDLRFTATAPTPDRPRAEHEAAVRRGLEYIAAGDVFQVNLAQRFTAEFKGSTRGLFLQLAAASPAWYGAYLEPFTADGRPAPHAVCSTSPELFLQLDADGTVTTRPIKGTRPAASDPNELRDAEKDTAELNMIIDLLRNDLGRVCGYGSVRVTQPRTVESHPTVHHGVATVAGRLHPSRALRHLLRATFPGGSITGAPKVRAMQIIEELEPVRRGVYCGAIGFATSLGGTTTARLNIAIRTLLVDRATGRLHFSVGGGIVADSDPADEYEETLHKAAALVAALRAGEPSAAVAEPGA